MNLGSKSDRLSGCTVLQQKCHCDIGDLQPRGGFIGLKGAAGK